MQSTKWEIAQDSDALVGVNNMIGLPSNKTQQKKKVEILLRYDLQLNKIQ